MNVPPKLTRNWTPARILVAAVIVCGLMGYWSYEQNKKTMANMMCGKNLSQIYRQMDLYSGEHGVDEGTVCRMAGLLISSTNFNRQYGFYKNYRNKPGEECWNWRYSRDGLFATCALSPVHERLSCEGWPTTNIVLVPGIPLIWEKGPYHDGKRHVFRYQGPDGMITLMHDAEFHALTNSFAKNVSLPKP